MSCEYLSRKVINTRTQTLSTHQTHNELLSQMTGIICGWSTSASCCRPRSRAGNYQIPVNVNCVCLVWRWSQQFYVKFKHVKLLRFGSRNVPGPSVLSVMISLLMISIYFWTYTVCRVFMVSAHFRDTIDSEEREEVMLWKIMSFWSSQGKSHGGQLQNNATGGSVSYSRTCLKPCVKVTTDSSIYFLYLLSHIFTLLVILTFCDI